MAKGERMPRLDTLRDGESFEEWLSDARLWLLGFQTRLLDDAVVLISDDPHSASQV